jgi:hypothetical protein
LSPAARRASSDRRPRKISEKPGGAPFSPRAKKRALRFQSSLQNQKERKASRTGILTPPTPARASAVKPSPPPFQGSGERKPARTRDASAARRDAHGGAAQVIRYNPASPVAQSSAFKFQEGATEKAKARASRSRSWRPAITRSVCAVSSSEVINSLRRTIQFVVRLCWDRRPRHEADPPVARTTLV